LYTTTALGFHFGVSHQQYLQHKSLANLRHYIDSNLKNLGEKDFFTSLTTSTPDLDLAYFLVGIFGTPLPQITFPFPHLLLQSRDIYFHTTT
jgi:hypothetical protein